MLAMVPAELSVAKQRCLSWSATRTDLAAVAGATALAGGLSLLFIGSKSLWIDEAASLYFARDGATIWHKLAHREANMWLYYLLLHLWLRLGDSEATVRALSALCATATVPVVYVLGRRLFGSRAGAIAALLLAWHPFLIRYAQEARSYTLLIFAVTLGSYFFVRARQDGARRNWVGHGVVMGLALYAHFFAGLAYLAQAATLPWTSKAGAGRKGFLLSAALVGAFVVPIVLFQPVLGGQIQWVQPLTPAQLYRFATSLTGSRPLLLLYFVSGALALVIAARGRARHQAARAWWPYLFVTVWLLVPVGVVTVFSALVAPVLVDRYLIVSLPPLVLLAAAGIASLRPRWLCVPVLVLFLCGSARSVNQWYRADKKDDWRGVTAAVLAQARPGDAALFYVYTGRHCFDYYRDRVGADSTGPASLELSLETRTGRGLELDVNEPLLSSLPAKYERVWLILAHDAASAAQPDKTQILAHLEDNYVRTQEQEFTGVKVLLYVRPEPPPPRPSGALRPASFSHRGESVAGSRNARPSTGTRSARFTEEDADRGRLRSVSPGPILPWPGSENRS